jgi:adenylosuccinate lyase
MLRLWSARHKFNTWRRIWLAVAEAQHELTQGAPSGPLVTREQVEELRAVVNRVNPDGSVALPTRKSGSRRSTSGSCGMM